MPATASSSPLPTAGVIVSFSPMMRAPTTVKVVMWPAPQRTPTSAPSVKRRSRVMIVATATRWSGSVACWRPRTKPRKIAESAGSTGVDHSDILRRSPVRRARWIAARNAQWASAA